MKIMLMVFPTKIFFRANGPFCARMVKTLDNAGKTFFKLHNQRSQKVHQNYFNYFSKKISFRAIEPFCAQN